MKIRKIAANYIFLPGFPLVKNGFVILEDGQVKEVVDTGGRIQEIQGLEFYGGMIVPDYVRESKQIPELDESLLLFFEKLFRQRVTDYTEVAILEGADLLLLKWKKGAKFRKL